MLLAPKGTPKEIVARLNQELNAAMSDPAVRARITEQGAETLVLSPQEVAAFLSSEVAKWRDIIHKAGIEPIQ
jgi:tripartite-type tricarboxylate transporter receptor subunit TctC